MEKAKKIVYWISTLWMALGMVSTGIVQIMQIPEDIELVIKLGYPAYFLPLLGTWKILGSIVAVIPKFRLLKEWAYAGFVFCMSGALYSHIVSRSPMNETFPAILLFSLVVISYLTRPAHRKIG